MVDCGNSLNTSEGDQASGAEAGAAGPAPGKTTGTVLALCVNIAGEPLTVPGKNVKHIDMEEESQDCKAYRHGGRVSRLQPE